MEQKRKILPAVYLIICLVFIWVLQRFLPVFQYVEPPWAYTGIMLVLVGIGISAISAGMFKRAGTGLIPFDEATILVTTGFYRFSRNPMYLGMLLMLLGVAFLMGSLGALLPILGFLLIIRHQFVLGEERFLEETFGQQYQVYKSAVRRWI